jgi:hypothetical protein
MGTSTTVVTPQPLPVEEYSLRPQLMEPDVPLSVAFTAEVRAGHRAVQFVEPLLQLLSDVVL